MYPFAIWAIGVVLTGMVLIFLGSLDGKLPQNRRIFYSKFGEDEIGVSVVIIFFWPVLVPIILFFVFSNFVTDKIVKNMDIKEEEEVEPKIDLVEVGCDDVSN